jgi:hypothetical protein
MPLRFVSFSPVHGVSNIRDGVLDDLDQTTFSTLSGPGVSVTESIGPCVEC